MSEEDLKNANPDAYIETRAKMIEDIEKPTTEQTAEKRAEEIRRLQQKSVDSTVNVVTKIVEKPEVQNVLKKNINKQTFISGLFMSFLLIGFLQISNVAKTLIAYNWQGDLIIGLVLIIIGAAYMAREMRPVKTQKS